MPQLILYVSLVFASLIGQANQIDINLDAGIHQNTCSLIAGGLAPNFNFDDGDASTSSHLALNIPTDKHIYFSQVPSHDEQDVYRNNTARSPPALLS